MIEPANDDIVIAKGVHKTYDSGKGIKVHALRGIDLMMKRGDVVAVMGPSICGKATLLNCLSGLDDIGDQANRIIKMRDGSIVDDGIPK